MRRRAGVPNNKLLKRKVVDKRIVGWRPKATKTAHKKRANKR